VGAKSPEKKTDQIKDVIQHLFDVQSAVHGYMPETQGALVEKMYARLTFFFPLSFPFLCLSFPCLSFPCLSFPFPFFPLFKILLLLAQPPLSQKPTNPEQVPI
jgi:hypothetical protein